MFEWLISFTTGKLNEFCTVIVSNTSELSYWICLFAALICLILTLAGYKKAKGGSTVAIVVYALIQCFLSVLI